MKLCVHLVVPAGSVGLKEFVLGSIDKEIVGAAPNDVSNGIFLLGFELVKDFAGAFVEPVHLHIRVLLLKRGFGQFQHSGTMGGYRPEFFLPFLLSWQCPERERFVTPQQRLRLS